MKLRNPFVVGITALALFFLAGCLTGASQGGSGSSGSGEADGGGDQADENANSDQEGSSGTGGDANGNDADEENANQQEEEEDQEPTLTEEEAEAVDAAVAVVSDLADLFASLGAGDLPEIGDGSATLPDQLPECPTLSLEGTQLAIDYGDGCSPTLYPDSTVSGSIAGEINLAGRTITFTLNDFSIDEQTIDGTVEASVSQQGDLLILETTVNVTFSDAEQTVTYTGDVTAELDLVTGELFIPSADVAATDQAGDTYAVEVDDVHIDLVEVLPDSGTVTVILGTQGPGALTVAVTFTEQTPTNGTVLVSVNGSPPITLSLDDLDALLTG